MAWLLSLVLVWQYKPKPYEDYSEIIQKASKAVVAIETETLKQIIQAENAGSGFLIDPAGLVLTNEHVVHDAKVIRVTLSDRRKFVAKIVAADTRSDLAVLKIEAENLPTLPLVPAEDLAPGQVVIALGNPYGTGADGISVSQMGRISRLQQTSSDLDPTNDRFYDNLIQTTAVIYPGNSGGPLIDKYGYAVGINTAMGTSLSSDAQFGFAIAFDRKIRSILEQLKAGGAIFHAFLGVHPTELDENARNTLNLKDISGALVSAVFPGSPAQQAGILLGDVIRAVDDQNIYNPNDLISYINSSHPGIIVEVSLLRKGYPKTQELTLPVRLEERTLEDLEGYTQEGQMTSSAKWGMAVKDLIPWRRRKLNLPPAQPGVLVYSVEPDSAADQQNIRPGTIITAIGYNKVDNLRDFDIAARKHPNLPRVEILKRQN